jgi:hypothetical protein
MKALAGVLLAVALAMGISSETNAQCKMGKPATKKVTTHKVAVKKKSNTTACVCRVTPKKKKVSMMRTRSFAGYRVDTTYRETLSAPNVVLSDTLLRPQGQWDVLGEDNRWDLRNENMPRERGPILNGGSLDARMNGSGHTNPNTINNGMQNSQAAQW